MYALLLDHVKGINMRIRTLARRIGAMQEKLAELEDERRRWALRQVMDYGNSQAAAARECGVTRSRVNQWVRERQLRGTWRGP